MGNSPHQVDVGLADLDEVVLRRVVVVDAALAGGARFDTVVGDFVRRRIAFGGAAVYEAVIG